MPADQDQGSKGGMASQQSTRDALYEPGRKSDKELRVSSCRRVLVHNRRGRRNRWRVLEEPSETEATTDCQRAIQIMARDSRGGSGEVTTNRKVV